MIALLINPPAIDTIEEHDAPAHPNISVGTLAAYLLEQGIEVDVIDAKFERLNFEQTTERFKKRKYGVVGLTSFTHDINNAHKLAKDFKLIDPEIVTVIGGFHVTAVPYETLETFPYFDIAAVGECEYTFHEICEAIKNKKDFSHIFGIYYREKNGEIKINPVRMREQDLEKFPLPAWHLFPKSKYYQIMTARGCPNFCSFCMSPYGRKIMRMRSPEHIIKEIEWLINTYHPKKIRFNDETFSHDYDRATKILDMIIEKGFNKKTGFIISTRANKVDVPLLNKMKEANTIVLEIGVETGDPDIIIKTHKGITLDQTEKAVKISKEAGLYVACGFIIGHPYETKETAKKTVDYMAKLNPHRAAIGIMVPYPGTEVYELARQGKANYKLLSTNWADYNKQMGNALEMQNFNRKEMERMQALAYLKLYTYNFRIFDLIKFVWTYRKAGMFFLKKQLGLGFDYNRIEKVEVNVTKTTATV